MTNEQYLQTKREILLTNDIITEAYLQRNYKRMDLYRIYLNDLIDKILEMDKIDK